MPKKSEDDSILEKTNGRVRRKGGGGLPGMNLGALRYRINQRASLTERW